MMKMISKGRKAWLSAIGLWLLPVLLFILFLHPLDRGSAGSRELELQTVQSGNGWGYQIMMNRKVLIYQPTIPAIDTVMAFPDEESASRIGSRVLEKVKGNRDFSVTPEEVSEVLALKRPGR